MHYVGIKFAELNNYLGQQAVCDSCEFEFYFATTWKKIEDPYSIAATINANFLAWEEMSLRTGRSCCRGDSFVYFKERVFFALDR